MYFIGPLLFWACAEMTCGFFILSVPCLPKLITESGLPRKLKEYLVGLSISKSAGPSNGNSEIGARSESHLRKASNSYYKIGDDDTRMSNFDRSESQEHLHEGYNTQDGKNGMQVTRMTHIAVTSDSQSGSSNSLRDNVTPWTR